MCRCDIRPPPKFVNELGFEQQQFSSGLSKMKNHGLRYNYMSALYSRWKAEVTMEVNDRQMGENSQTSLEKSIVSARCGGRYNYIC